MQSIFAAWQVIPRSYCSKIGIIVRKRTSLHFFFAPLPVRTVLRKARQVVKPKSEREAQISDLADFAPRARYLDGRDPARFSIRALINVMINPTGKISISVMPNLMKVFSYISLNASISVCIEAISS